MRPVPGTLLGGLMAAPVRVPTCHHQAVDRLGSGLVASSFASDGTVEAVELPGGGFVLGVQWHPEAGQHDHVVSALTSAATSRAG